MVQVEAVCGWKKRSVEGFKRINQTRTDQLLEPKPEMIITNCPFCLTMINDGVKETGDEVNQSNGCSRILMEQSKIRQLAETK